jgi:hypothetical protein
LQAFSQRYSWIRLGLLVLGGALVWFAAVQFGSAWAWRAAFLFLLIFSLVAIAHRRLEAWIERLRIWQGLKTSYLARQKLAWEGIPGPAPASGLSDASLEVDLDLTGRHSLHQLLDIAISREGSQLLAGWLAQSDPDPQEVNQRQAIVRELVPMVTFRDRLLLTFRLASKDPLEGDVLLRWLQEEVPADRLRWLLPVSAIWVAVNLALFVLNSFNLLPAYWILSLSLYLVFYLGNNLNPFFEAIVHLDRELFKFRIILKYLETAPLGRAGTGVGRENLARLLAPLRQEGTRPSDRLRKVRWATAGAGLRMNPVTGLLLNLILPWDFAFAYLAAVSRREIASSLPDWLRVLYTLEADLSLSNFAYLNPDYTFPEIHPAAVPVLQFEGLGHPLLPAEAKVCNDFRFEALGQVAVITGSNMSGKSTFIKAIGANLCLAYAGAPVNARIFRARPFRLHSCIRISDSITDGFSYFYAEVKCLKRLLEKLASPGQPLLYLIDEIFRGTNNRERLIGSRAYLQRLAGERGVGFIATHDLELSHLAEERAGLTNLHFRDEVRDGRLVFDYRLRPGPSPTTNALKIMRLEGLPVDEA